ncbi:hypothetical protein FOQG_08700 [Fusarium oxysporum f. sp. raphani 54005]|uniref:Uncharacterized protein n=5 Tax=Fusarium oxysporum TaxID=5507 RepID=X0C9B6_FUSOX|nr:hypothetical protein FOVG_04188 [Fusarium oxysporum f. sp. pisi HDV247]EXK87803.1 hypothetical protein FOQG_08700 [Fusarium oxysporum f. sp. raphani 54005]EXL85740.1 hypothetical protein FOPG_02517 [Fusarium oxysporum f. sp. conglutinans race 2 54008]EXM23108.1 hypothetical protein FOTG_09432 [Fusarium oxysporum f. sp. vasinfectum 25433]KAI8413749.1 hypothetical protein FOFC_07033 [Fusarium oxysporum]
MSSPVDEVSENSNWTIYFGYLMGLAMEIPQDHEYHSLNQYQSSLPK